MVQKNEVETFLKSERIRLFEGRTEMEVLLEKLDKGNYLWDKKIVDNELRALFFIPIEQFSYIEKFNTVFVMDITYKSNKYKMPLLNIVGFTSTNKTFNAGFAFVKGQTEESYRWVLETFQKIVQPRVFCIDLEVPLFNGNVLID